VDPLGLASVYERLADRILPGLTVRMGRPRFLTGVAVGAFICKDYAREDVAADGVTPPYLAFEWWIIEAFARAREALAESGRIPGLQKVSTAVRNNRPVSASAYLKTASVFGFSGVFRRLARRIQIIGASDLLDEAGIRLIRVWADEQGLDGFCGGNSGSGADLRSALQKAVRDAMRDGTTAPRPASFWQSIVRHLDPARPGRHEAALLLELIEARAGQSDEVGYLINRLRRGGDALAPMDEPAFLRELTARAPERLQTHLRAIDAYEDFCRPLTDAFDWLRFLASSSPTRSVTRAEFNAAAPIKSLATRLKKAIETIEEHPTLTELWPDRAEALIPLRESASAPILFDGVLHHHRRSQDKKPPEGKRTWVEDEGRGRVLIRAAYTVEQPPSGEFPYVHEYRVPTLSRFLADLGAYQ
jgi:hypothetical protein